MLHDLADRLSRLGEEKITLTAAVAKLESSLADYQQRETTLQEALVASRQMGEDIKSNAHKEAQTIIEAAQTKADGLLNQGTMRLAKILEEISQARKIKTRFDIKLRAVLESHLRLLDLEKEEDARLAAGLEQPGARRNPNTEP